MAESTPQLIKRLADEGGRILLVGGEITTTLPDHVVNHPRVTVWDDRKQGIENRQVPGSTKAIIWSRFVSHPTANRLNEAVKALSAVKFPMKTEREIKELMSAFEPPPAPPVEEKPAPPVVTTPEPHQTKGTLSTFVASHLDLSKDYSVKGSKTAEGTRLFDLANKAGIRTTLASVVQCVGITTLKLMNPSKPAKPTPPPPAKAEASTLIQTKKRDDFEELEELITNAIVAMQLVKEHLPKVRTETERLRGLRERMLKMLE